MITLTHGMVLAAGLGLRMRPLTETTAKPLLTLNGRSLLDHALDRLEAAGVQQAVVNAHWQAGKVAAAVAGRATPRIALQREDVLLETGGGVDGGDSSSSERWENSESDRSETSSSFSSSPSKDVGSKSGESGVKLVKKA